MLPLRASSSRERHFRTHTSPVRAACGALALAALLLLTACPGEPEPFTLELGTAETHDTFLPLAEGGEVHMHRGPQGGQHVWVALRSMDVTEGTAHVRVSLTDADSGERLTLPSVGYVPFLSNREGGALHATGLTLVIDDPVRVLGRRARLEAQVTDAQGRPGMDARTVVVRWSASP